MVQPAEDAETKKGRAGGTETRKRAAPRRQSPAAALAMRTSTQRPRRGHRPPSCTMTIAMLLVASLARCAGEPLRAALQRRSARPGVYADAFARDYRPFAFVAVPLHAPVPVLHVLYPAPQRQAPPASRAGPQAMQASQLAPVYAAAAPHGWPASPPLPRRPAQPMSPPEETALEVVYARPTAQGGYAYSRRRTRPAPSAPPRRPPRPQPVIIRVHKYRVVRDR